MLENDEIFNNARKSIRKQQPYLSEQEVEIELAKRIERNAAIRRALLELEASSELEGLDMADQQQSIQQQAFGNQTENLRMQFKARELDTLKLIERRRQREAAKFEAFLDLPSQTEFTTDFLHKWIKNAGFEVTFRAIQKALEKICIDREKTSEKSWKGDLYRLSRVEAVEYLRKFHLSPRRVKRL